MADHRSAGRTTKGSRQDELGTRVEEEESGLHPRLNPKKTIINLFVATAVSFVEEERCKAHIPSIRMRSDERNF